MCPVALVRPSVSPPSPVSVSFITLKAWSLPLSIRCPTRASSTLHVSGCLGGIVRFPTFSLVFACCWFPSGRDHFHIAYVSFLDTTRVWLPWRIGAPRLYATSGNVGEIQAYLCSDLMLGHSDAQNYAWVLRLGCSDAWTLGMLRCFGSEARSDARMIRFECWGARTLGCSDSRMLRWFRLSCSSGAQARVLGLSDSRTHAQTHGRSDSGMLGPSDTCTLRISYAQVLGCSDARILGRSDSQVLGRSDSRTLRHVDTRMLCSDARTLVFSGARSLRFSYA